MNLHALNSIDAEARGLDSTASQLEQAANFVACLRSSGGEASFGDQIRNLAEKSNYGSAKAARDELWAVLTDCRENLIELTELRLRARAREARIQAMQRRAVLAASILPVPGATKEES